MPDLSAIDAVLDYEKHNYLYFVASGRGVSGIPYNPSSIAYIEKSEAYFSQVSYLAGITHGVLTYGTRIGPSNFAGLHLFYLDSGPMEVTTELFPDGTGENFKVMSLAARATFARSLTESAVYKLRKHVEQVDDSAEDDDEVGDDFENLYKGEISKSGTPILPSKRARKAPEKIQVSKDDLAELSQTAQPEIESTISDETEEDQANVSLEEVSESENQEPNDNSNDSEGSNS